MVVCSARGDVLYEWQCADVNDRISFLEFLSQKSIQLGEGLDLGPFDRLEVEGGRTRVIAQVKPDRGIFIRAGEINFVGNDKPRPFRKPRIIKIDLFAQLLDVLHRIAAFASGNVDNEKENFAARNVPQEFVTQPNPFVRAFD